MRYALAVACVGLLLIAPAPLLAQGAPPPPPPPPPTPPGYAGPAPATGVVTTPAAGPAEEAAEPIDVPDDTVIAKVGDDVFTWGGFLDELHKMPPQYRIGMSKDRRLELVDTWVEMQLLYREALRRNIDERADVKARLDDLRKQVLVHFLRNELMESAVEVTEDEIAEYYNSHIDTYVVPEQIKMRHVMTTKTPAAEGDGSPEERIRAVASELAAGAEFTQLARERSDDNASKMRGGDVGFIDRRRCNALYGAAVEKAAFALEKGGTSEPVEGTRGWHVIRIDAKQPARQRELKDVSTSIESTIRRKKQEQQYQATMNKLRREAEVEVNRDLVMKATPELRRDRPAPLGGVH